MQVSTSSTDQSLDHNNKCDISTAAQASEVGTLCPRSPDYVCCVQNKVLHSGPGMVRQGGPPIAILAQPIPSQSQFDNSLYVGTGDCGRCSRGPILTGPKRGRTKQMSVHDGLESAKKIAKVVKRVLSIWAVNFRTSVVEGNLHIFLDMGAGVTCIGKAEFELVQRHLRNFGIVVDMIKKSKRVTGVGGSVKTLGEAYIPLCFKSKYVKVRTIIIDGDVPFLLSNKVIRKLGGDILN